MRISLVIPTLNAGPLLDDVLAHLKAHDGEDVLALGILALRRHGRGAEAEALMAGLDERERKRVDKRMGQKRREEPLGGCRL